MNRKFKKILLIDDDNITNYLNTQLLNDMDVAEEIVVCTSGDEALQWFTDQNPLTNVDIIFLDINMPGLDGFEFLEKIKEMSDLDEARVVLLTTSNNNRDQDKAGSFNVKGYINKPLNEQKVKALLNNW